MNRQELINLIRHKKSFLCIGLDTDISKIPSHLKGLEDLRMLRCKRMAKPQQNH